MENDVIIFQIQGVIRKYVSLHKFKVLLGLFGRKYSRTDQVEFVKDSFTVSSDF